MARFDGWVTDREVTIEKVRSFAGTSTSSASGFLERNTVATTSGTTGTPGIVLLPASSCWTNTVPGRHQCATLPEGQCVVGIP